MECSGIQRPKALRLEKVFECFLLFLLRNDYEIRFASVCHYLEKFFVLVWLLVELHSVGRWPSTAASNPNSIGNLEN